LQMGFFMKFARVDEGVWFNVSLHT